MHTYFSLSPQKQMGCLATQPVLPQGLFGPSRAALSSPHNFLLDFGWRDVL